MAKRNKKRGERPRKQIVLFIVEGDSDIIALENPLEQYFDEHGMNINLFFCKLSRDRDGEEIHGGDSTSAFGIYEDNFDEEITKRIMRDVTSTYGVYAKDIAKVIQITDLDGTFIPDAYVFEKNDCESTLYSEDGIYTSNRERIIKRNCKKSCLINSLIQKRDIKLKSTTVEYGIYYFSCNMDHFTADERNMEDNYKKRNAMAFQDRCLDDPSYFESEFINGDHITKNMTYRESWNYAKEGINSLSRMSNINLMLEDIEIWWNRTIEVKVEEENE